MLSVPFQTQRQPLRISIDASPSRTCLQLASSDGASGSSSPTNPSLTNSGVTPSSGNSDWFICHVLCMYDFESPDPDHLSFDKDEVLTVIKQEESGWWAAMRPQGDCIGWIPSSFVEPLTEQMINELQSAQDRGKVVEYQEETPRRYEGIGELDDPPRSATHNPWVPIVEDFKVPSLQLVTPTDLVSQKDSQDDRMGKHTCDSFFSLFDEERSPLSAGYGFVRVPTSPIPRVPQPPTPQSPAFHTAQKLSFLLNPHPHPQTLQPIEFVPPERTGTAASRHPRPRGVVVDDQASLLRLSTLLEADQTVTLDLVDSPDIKESLLALNRTLATQNQGPGICRDNGNSLHPKGLPASPRPAARCDSDAKPVASENDLIAWDPDDVAEQFCVLMHDLYAVIRPRECLDWVKARTGTNIAYLRRFFDVHDQITMWVQRSILSYDNLARRTEAFDFWIRVVETCRSLHNFDTSSAIISGLSSAALSLLRSTRVRCTHKQNFDVLYRTYDAANNLTNLMVAMTTAEGPSVPSIRVYLESIREIDQECADDLPPNLDYKATVGLPTRRRRICDAVSTMLRHQSSFYDFGITKSTRRFIDEQLAH
ncbi:ras GEF [Gyrodon lividus]|nr:ras GEF [Gyrodon lividus]